MNLKLYRSGPIQYILSIRSYKANRGTTQFKIVRSLRLLCVRKRQKLNFMPFKAVIRMRWFWRVHQPWGSRCHNANKLHRAL